MRLVVLLFCCTIIFSCSKENETLDIARVSQLYPLSVGKTFFYRLDSTMPANFGSSLITKSYIAKDSVEATFTDGAGRKSFRIFRYITDTLSTKPWQFVATYTATIDSNKIEFVDNNLRYVPLVNPITNNTVWKGNVYINTILPSPYYFLDNWDYVYTNINEPFRVKKGLIQNTYTILQQDVQSPSVFNPSIYNAKSLSKEVYAKNIGLIYKEFLYYIWQPTPTPARFQDDAYGVKLSLIDYR